MITNVDAQGLTDNQLAEAISILENESFIRKDLVKDILIRSLRSACDYYLNHSQTEEVSAALLSTAEWFRKEVNSIHEKKEGE